MSIPSKRRSGQSHDFFPSWSKLSRIVGEIKSKRKSLHQNLPVDFINFPLFPVPASISSSSSSCHKSAATSTITNPPAEAHPTKYDVTDGKEPSFQDPSYCFVPSSQPPAMPDAPPLTRKKKIRQRMTQLAPWMDLRSPNTVPAECAEMAPLKRADIPSVNPVKKKKTLVRSQLSAPTGEIAQTAMVGDKVSSTSRGSVEMPESDTLKKKKSRLTSWLSASSAELCQSDLVREKIARISSLLPTRYAHMLDADTLAKKMSHMPSRPLSNTGEPTRAYQVAESNLDMPSRVSERSVELFETRICEKRHACLPDLHAKEFQKEQCGPIFAEKMKEQNGRAGTDLNDLLPSVSREKKHHVGAELSQKHHVGAELSQHLSSTNSPEMKKIYNSSLKQGAKLAVLTILCLCAFYIGKELAVLITIICHLLSMLTSRLGLSKQAEIIQFRRKPVHVFDQGNHCGMQEHKLNTRCFFRSSTIPAQGRLSVPAKQKATRSRSLPRIDVALSEADHVISSSTSRLENMDFSLCKGMVSAEGKGIATATLKPKIVLLFILSGLLYGRVIAVCTASCCILILFKLQKRLQARGYLLAKLGCFQV